MVFEILKSMHCVGLVSHFEKSFLSFFEVDDIPDSIKILLSTIVKLGIIRLRIETYIRFDVLILRGDVSTGECMRTI